MKKLTNLIFFLSQSILIFSQNDLKILFKIERDSILVGEKINYTINFENNSNEIVWLRNFSLDKGANISLVQKNEIIPFIECSKPFFNYNDDEWIRTLYYTFSQNQNKEIGKYSYDWYLYNPLISKLKEDKVEIKISYKVGYSKPNSYIKNKVINWGSNDIVYFDDEHQDTLREITINSSKLFNLYIKPFSGIDKKAYKWLKRNNIFWQLFIPYDKNFDYTKYNKFIKKYPNTCFELKAKFRLMSNVNPAENVKRYAEILNSNLVDYYGVKPEIEQMLNYDPKLKEEVNALLIDKK